MKYLHAKYTYNNFSTTLNFMTICSDELLCSDQCELLFIVFLLSDLLLVVCILPVSDIWGNAISKYWTFIPIVW